MLRSLLKEGADCGNGQMCSSAAPSPAQSRGWPKVRTGSPVRSWPSKTFYVFFRRSCLKTCTITHQNLENLLQMANGRASKPVENGVNLFSLSHTFPGRSGT